MTDQGSVNGQILDSVADTVTIAAGLAPSQSYAMLDTVMVETLGMAMYNAVSRQQGGSMVGSAAVTAACAKMLGTSISASPKPPAPPTIQPLPTPPIPPAPYNPPIPPAPPPVDPSAIIGEATQRALFAIQEIHNQGATASQDESQANQSLQAIATNAAQKEIPPTQPPHAGSTSRRPPRPQRRP